MSACLAATGAVGCGKTDVAVGANGRPLVVPAWAAPTPENGFRAVAPEPAVKCPSQGYEMRSGGYYRDESAGEPR